MSESKNWRRYLDSKLLVLGLLFFVMAILGIPLLWLSNAFSKIEKVFWTVIVVVYTALLFLGTYWVLRWSWNQIQSTLS